MEIDKIEEIEEIEEINVVINNKNLNYYYLFYV